MQSLIGPQHKAVICDLDGTLYDQAGLRKKMSARLLAHCLKGPKAWREVKALAVFRRVREKLAEEESRDPRREQYLRAARGSGFSPGRVKRLVEDWILQRPLPLLAACRRPGVARFFGLLKARGLGLAVVSDYPAEDKLAALGLKAAVTLCSVSGPNRLKPHPAAFLEAARLLDCAPKECLVIGDRDERDGEAARRAGMAYLILQGGGAGPANSFTDFGQLCRALEAKGNAT